MARRGRPKKIRNYMIDCNKFQQQSRFNSSVLPISFTSFLSYAYAIDSQLHFSVILLLTFCCANFQIYHRCINAFYIEPINISTKFFSNCGKGEFGSSLSGSQTFLRFSNGVRETHVMTLRSSLGKKIRQLEMPPLRISFEGMFCVGLHVFFSESVLACRRVII